MYGGMKTIRKQKACDTIKAKNAAWLCGRTSYTSSYNNIVIRSHTAVCTTVHRASDAQMVRQHASKKQQKSHLTSAALRFLDTAPDARSGTRSQKVQHHMRLP